MLNVKVWCLASRLVLKGKAITETNLKGVLRLSYHYRACRNSLAAPQFAKKKFKGMHYGTRGVIFLWLDLRKAITPLTVTRLKLEILWTMAWSLRKYGDVYWTEMRQWLFVAVPLSRTWDIYSLQFRTNPDLMSCHLLLYKIVMHSYGNKSQPVILI